MIPNFEWSLVMIGPIPIRIWGLMVALGIATALFIAVKAAKQRGLEVQRLLDMAFWIILSSLVSARIFFVLTEISQYLAEPLDVFKVWEGGMSITGGFLGSVLAAFLYLRKHKLNYLEYTDVVVFGLPVGLWIGRLGCFFVFDHPGTATSFFLGEQFTDGVVRHNHGLYLSLNGLILSIIFFILWKKNPDRKPGFYAVFFMIWYGIVRFSLDFFRAYDLAVVDSRVGPLTFAQIFMVLMVVAGLFIWYSLNRKDTKTTHG